VPVDRDVLEGDAGEVEVEAGEVLRRPGDERDVAGDVLLGVLLRIAQCQVVRPDVVAAVPELREEPVTDADGPGAARAGGDDAAGVRVRRRNDRRRKSGDEDDGTPARPAARTRGEVCGQKRTDRSCTLT
jgi:hypothetical protein